MGGACSTVGETRVAERIAVGRPDGKRKGRVKQEFGHMAEWTSL